LLRPLLPPRPPPTARFPCLIILMIALVVAAVAALVIREARAVRACYYRFDALKEWTDVDRMCNPYRKREFLAWWDM
jgi:hypothetical protein